MGEEQDLLGRVRTALSKLAEGADVREVLKAVLAVVSEASGCESVGIRWRAEEDYPYYLTRGFGIDFVVQEGPLCDRDSAGLILRLPDGTPQLACLCGAVIQGRGDPSQPFFTKGGSFWTNGTNSLAQSSPVWPPGCRPRMYCNKAGYESVALLPLRTKKGIGGLLQLNSRTPGRFSKERIALYEQAAAEIAAAVADRIGGG